MTRKKKKEPEPDVIRFSDVSQRYPSSFTITNISEQDIRQLNNVIVPNWIMETTAFWLRDNPKPSDVPASFGVNPHEAQS